MPPLDEGSILYMPVTFPGASITEVNRILQEQDKIIKTIPEVHQCLEKQDGLKQQQTMPR